MFRRRFIQRWAPSILVSLSLVAVATSIIDSGASAHSSRRASARSLADRQPGLLSDTGRRGYWMTIGGKRVWGVHVVLQVRNGSVVAHAASACGTSGSCHQNLGSGLCMSSYPNQQAQAIEQYSCNGSLNQSWTYFHYSDDMPYLKSDGAGVQKDLCLNNYGGGFSNGNKMALWSCESTSAAMWFGAGASSHSGYSLVHLYASIGRWSQQCLTTLGNTANGSPIEQWACNVNAANQQFDGNWNPLQGGCQSACAGDPSSGHTPTRRRSTPR